MLTFFSDSLPLDAKGGGIKDGTYLKQKSRLKFHSTKNIYFTQLIFLFFLSVKGGSFISFWGSFYLVWESFLYLKRVGLKYTTPFLLFHSKLFVVIYDQFSIIMKRSLIFINIYLLLLIQKRKKEKEKRGGSFIKKKHNYPLMPSQGEKMV